MKHQLLLPLLALAGCGYYNPAAYERAKAAASRQPVFPRVWAGLRLGMTPAQVTHTLDSLREQQALTWPLGTSRLPLKPEARYADGKLAELRLLLLDKKAPDGLAYSEVLGSLDETYGHIRYEHDGGVGAYSWFKGGTEIAMMGLPGEGYSITYTDLHSLDALAVQQLRADSLRQAQQE